jgi:hypothetical protein
MGQKRSSLTQYLLAKPQFPKIQFAKNQSTHLEILERSPTKLLLRINYAPFISIFYCFLALFVLPCAIAGCWLLLQASSFQWFAALLGLLCFIPLYGLVWLLQNIGFWELWIFEPNLDQFTIQRRLAIGFNVKQLSCKAIRAVIVAPAPTPRDYMISLKTADSVAIDPGQRRKGDRILYTTPSLQTAHAIAELLRHYLNLPTEL